MKDKTYEVVMLILHCVLYGIAIGFVIFNGLKDGLDIALLVGISILLIGRVFSATITLLDKGNENER
jgi:hypothetical protein